MPERVRIAERTGVQAPFRPLASDLASFLEKHMCVFLQSALESLLVAGFVVFVIRTHELRGKTLEVPVALPLGAFTWSVQPVGRDTKRRFVRDGALYYLEITPLHHDFSGRELHVYQVTEPVPDQDPMPSRVDGILAEFLALQSFEATIRRIDTWNSVKHITTSEAVNAPRDQTTDGITLLDEFRRYIMSGEQSGINQHYMVMSGNGAQREDPPTPPARGSKTSRLPAPRATRRACISCRPTRASTSWARSSSATTARRSTSASSATCSASSR